MTVQLCDLNSVVACIDGSELTNNVLDATLWCARQLQSPVGLLHAHDKTKHQEVSDLSGNIGMGSNEHLLASLSKEDLAKNTLVREQGQTILKSAKQYLLDKTELATFKPKISKIHRHQTLKKCVTELADNASVLVMGQDGLDDSKTIGTQLEKIIKHSTCPVFVATKAYTPPKKAVIAFDNKQNVKNGIKWLVKQPLLNKIEVHLVFVAEDNTENQENLRSASACLKQTGLDVHSSLLSGSPKEALIAYQTQNQTDLLVMGAYGHSKLQGLFRSSTTNFFLENNPTSMLIMHF